MNPVSNGSSCGVTDLEYIVKLLLVLQRTHPFTENLKTVTICADMFKKSNSHTSALIVYLLNVIDRKLCSTLVPVNPGSSAKFNQGVINFCRQIPIAPSIEFTGKNALGATLKSRSGNQFTLFILQLAKYAVKTVCWKQGSPNVPCITKLGEEERCTVLEGIERKFTYCLLHTLTKKAISDEARLSLEKDRMMLQRTKEALMVKSIALIERYPRRYEECLKGDSPEQRLAAAKLILKNKWLTDIESATAEQDEKHLFAKEVWKNFMNIPTIRAKRLVDEMNTAVLRRIALSSQWPLYINADLSLAGFLNSSIAVVEKLNQLLTYSTLAEQAKSPSELKNHLPTIDKDRKVIAELTSKVESQLEETERKYDECEVNYNQSVANRGGQRYFFPEWDTMPAVKVDESKNGGLALISSPANATIAAAINDARKALQCHRGSPLARTTVPNSPISRKFCNSSVSSLTRSVLQVKSWALGDREGDSTVGHIEPLSASSPHGPIRVMPMNPSISEIIDDAEHELRDIFSDSSEWSGSLGASSPSHAEPPLVGSGPRARRTSLDQCVDRFNALKKKMQLAD